LPAVALLLASGVFVTPRSSEAQAAKPVPERPAPWMQLNVLDVEPSKVDEFLAVQRELTERAKKAKTPWRTVSRTEVFGDSYRFFIATPVRSLAEFDRRPEADPALAPILNRLRQCLRGRTSYAVRNMPDVGNPLPEGERPDLMVVNVARVAPGREQDYLNIMTADFLPHFNEADVHHVTGALTFGGESGFVHVFYYPSFAELDKGSPVMRALGAEGAQAVTAKFSGIVTKSELFIARLVPELSYGPEKKAPTQ
jgi:hypothetical protein